MVVEFSTRLTDLSERIPGHFLGQNVDSAPQVIEHLLTNRPSPPVSKPLSLAYTDALAGFRERKALICRSGGADHAVQPDSSAPSRSSK